MTSMFLSSHIIDTDLLLSYIEDSEILRLLINNKIVTYEQIKALEKNNDCSLVFGAENLFESLAIKECISRLESDQIREF